MFVFAVDKVLPVQFNALLQGRSDRYLMTTSDARNDQL